MPDSIDITATRTWDIGASVPATQDLDIGFRHGGTDRLFYWVTGDDAPPPFDPSEALCANPGGWGSAGNSGLALRAGERLWFAASTGTVSFRLNARPS